MQTVILKKKNREKKKLVLFRSFGVKKKILPRVRNLKKNQVAPKGTEAAHRYSLRETPGVPRQ